MRSGKTEPDRDQDVLVDPRWDYGMGIGKGSGWISILSTKRNHNHQQGNVVDSNNIIYSAHNGDRVNALMGAGEAVGGMVKTANGRQLQVRGEQLLG